MIWNYYYNHKRNFPWRQTYDPYAIIVSEIMLQQTQTERVVTKYNVFLQELPNFQSIVNAPVAQVLKLWQGLGYNRRALNLKKLAEIIVTEFHGSVPDEPEILCKLPGIGKATAGSISAFVFNKPSPFIETNIRTVFIDYFFPQ